MKEELKIFEEILSQAFKLEASDIHILANGEVYFRVCKQIISSDIKFDKTESLLKTFSTSRELDLFDKNKDIDITSTYLKHRLRFNFYLSFLSVCVSIRLLPTEIPSLENLFLPPILKDIFTKTSGLILVSGATGSGKSTTIAATLEYVNENFSKHIICIEDPVEYIHENKKSFFSYRQITTDTLSFDMAIRASLRQDPDIIFIGELRDKDSIKSALLAAQMGHLVVGTTHSEDSSGTIFRIINSFGRDRLEIASELSLALQAVISQDLVVKDGKLRAINEILIATPAVKTLIREQKIHQIPSQITMGKEFGMMSFEYSRKLIL